MTAKIWETTKILLTEHGYDVFIFPVEASIQSGNLVYPIRDVEEFLQGVVLLREEL
jgi:hypothetical protein